MPTGCWKEKNKEINMTEKYNTCENGELLFEAGKAVWNLNFILKNGSKVIITPADMKKYQQSNSNGIIKCKWQESKAIASLEVNVTWKYNNGLFEGHLSYSVSKAEITAGEIHFPVVTLTNKAECQLVIPYNFGVLIPDATKNIFNNTKVKNQFTWSHMKCAQMQFSAYLSEEENIYFDTRDKKGYIKDFRFFLDAKGNHTYEGIHPISHTSTALKKYSLPYKVSIKSFKGSWYDAAQIYKKWALKQQWAVKSLQKRKVIDDVAAWVWNRGKVSEVVPPIERLKIDLDLPVALDWYWWHRNPYDTEYPRYFPPREGESVFKQTMQELKSNCILSQVYVNGMLWDMDDESWHEGGTEAVIIDKDGKELSHVFNPYTNHRLAYMCGSSEKFRNVILDTAKKLNQYGLRSLYLDVFGFGGNIPCYNSHHKHAPGNGLYHIAGFRQMLMDIRKACPDMLLSTESCPEMYMDLVDSGIILTPSAERLGTDPNESEGIPLFNAVYHGLFTLFGNYACIDGIPPYDPLWPQDGKWKAELDWSSICPDQFTLEVARGIVWGLQPTLVNLRMSQIEKPELRIYYEFFLDAVRFYYDNRAALLKGQMLDPGKLEVENIPVNILQRMVFTKEGEHKIIRRNFPGILSSHWMTEDGREFLILANYSRKDLKCRWSSRCGWSLEATMKPRSFKAIDKNRDNEIR